VVSEAMEIEQLKGEEIEQKQKKAEEYASQLERFTLFFMEIQVKAEDGNQLVMYSDDGDWDCSCNFFKKNGTCDHAMAVGRVFKAVPIVQPRGNSKDT
jgi:SWIM zinc finger